MSKDSERFRNMLIFKMYLTDEEMEEVLPVIAVVGLVIIVVILVFLCLN